MSNANSSLLESFEGLDFAGVGATSRDPIPGVPQMQDRLEDLNFSDLYIRIDQREASRYRIGPNEKGVSGIYQVPEIYEPHIDTIRTQISNQKRNEGTFPHDSMRLRFSKARVIEEQIYASIRRIPDEVPDLEGLQLNPDAIRKMRAWAKRRGIVLIGGATGAGKTTTAVSLIRDWLIEHGGAAVAIEDPPEYLLHGEVGKAGACYQLEVQSDEEWADAIKTALRWRPKIIFLGEIRTVAAARQALRASTSGHLVVTTVHGGSVDETVEALLRLAEADMGSEGARTVLSDNLIGVVLQRLGKFGPDVDIIDIPPKQRRNEGVKAAIRNNKTEGLAHDQFLAPRSV